jgi:hypothetical protein
MDDNYYLKIGRASDLKNPFERFLFRVFEIFPGFTSLTILSLAVFFSWWKPLWISIFIIFFVIFWLFRTIYFSFYLWIAYKRMEDYQKIDWIEKLDSLKGSDYSLINTEDWKEIYHLVVIPMYEESREILKDTIGSIYRSDYPKDRMIVVLGCEEKTRISAQTVADEMEKEFKDKFFRFAVFWHPKDISGEIAGKGSNETYAVRKTKEEIIDNLDVPYEKIIFSSFDADTCVYPKYFSCLSYKYLTCQKPTRTSFQPVPLYINNIWQAPVFSRIFSFSSSFWHTMNQERPDKLVTFSSHSMSFKALADVGFKQTNIVPDDSHIFWQCFFKYDGDYKVEPLYYPISMDANVAHNFSKTMINIYKQQRRWAYGAADIPYFMFGFLKNKKIPMKKKLTLGFELLEGHLSWATASILIFALGWLPLFLGGDKFSHTLLSYNLPWIISRIMTVSMLGLLISIYFSFLLLPPRPLRYTKFKYLTFFLGWFLFPISTIFFTSLPALDAQIRLMLGKYMGFWVTEKVRKN